MFAMLRRLLSGVVRVLKVAVGILIGSVVLCGFLQLFALGGTAGMVVAGVCWIVEKVAPVVMGAIASFVQSAQTVGTAAGILLGLLLLGLSKVIVQVAETLIGPVVAGYRTVRRIHPPAAA